jgi:hypothetical protein
MKYDWTRYWAPEGTEPKLRNGFLAASRYRSHRLDMVPGTDRLATLSDLEEPCAVLLGEPGIGKSTEVEKLYEEICQESGSTHQVLHVELGMIVDYASLQGELLETREVQSWKQGEAELTLILDALDECGMERISHHLSRNLLASPTLSENLTLRITCRSSDWPESLNRSLRRFWELKDLPVYHLAPLRREDVKHAAQVNDVDAEPFLGKVTELGVGPFAASPLTLDALLSSFLETGEIPARKADLFGEYCLRLSREENENRRDAEDTGRLEPQRRVEILSRIAALMLFARRTRLCLQPWASKAADALSHSQDILFVDEALSRPDGKSSRTPAPSIRDVRDSVRHSGLLRGSDEGRSFRWRHRSFAEYLAARFIHDRGLSIEQVRPLIEHKYDGTVAPQYQNVAVWLATLDQESMEYLFEKDPSLILAGDPLQYDGERREDLVSGVLEGLDQEEMYSRLNERLDNMEGVSHPRLAEQLRPWIRDEERKDEARTYALQLARKKELESLVPDAIDLATNPSEDKYVRINAMRLIDDVGGARDREKLRPLAVDPGDEDHDRRVAYEAREILLPDLLTLSALLDQIRADAEWEEPEPVEGNWCATLDQWSTLICRRMDEDMLAEALQWALFEDAPAYFSDLRRSIVQRAVRHVDVEEIATAIANYVTERMREDYTTQPHVHLRDLDRARENQPDAHRDLARKIVESLAERSWNEGELRTVVAGLRSTSDLWKPEDIDWILDDLQRTENEDVEQVYATVVRSLFYRNGFPDPDGFSRIYEASQSSSVLREELQRWIDPVRLDSERATERREWEKKRQSWNADPLDPPFSQRLTEILDECKDEAIHCWVKLCNLLVRSSIEKDSARHEWHRDVTELPAWQELSDAEREEVMEAGLDYLRAAEVKQIDWMPEDQSKHRVRFNLIFGFIEFWLLAVSDVGKLSSVTVELWKKWCPAFFAYVPHTRQDRRLLISRAYNQAPNACRSVIETLLSRFPFRKQRLTFILDPIADEERIQGLLLRLIKEVDTPEQNRLALVPFLLARGVVESQSVAEELSEYPNEHDAFDGRKVDWLIDVLEADPRFGWSLIRDRLHSDDAWAEKVVRRMTRRRTNLMNLPNQALGAIYSRLHELFPPEEDPPLKFETHTPSFPEEVRDWRNGLVKVLRNRGTVEIIDTIEELAARFSDDRDWGRTLHLAKRSLREQSAPTVSPYTLLTLADDASRRIVRTSAELQRAVLESLSNLQDKIGAQEQPAAADLWNEISYGRQRDVVREWLGSQDASSELQDAVNQINGTLHFPKREELLSDHIARHLRHDLQERGITFTRESEIRVRNRTDILVKAPPTEDIDTELLSVVIEVKGAWNDELLSSVQTQLADRYLDPEDSAYGTSRGIYLVVWFNLEQWSRQDSRRDNACRYGSPEEIRTEVESRLSSFESRVEPFILLA